MITQHSFMFLSSFLTLREDLYKMLFENLVHLGTKAFEEIGGEVVQTATFTVRNVYCNDFISRYKRLVQWIMPLKKKMHFIMKKMIIQQSKTYIRLYQECL